MERGECNIKYLMLSSEQAQNPHLEITKDLAFTQRYTLQMSKATKHKNNLKSVQGDQWEEKQRLPQDDTNQKLTGNLYITLG